MSNSNKNDLTNSFQAKRGLWEESVLMVKHTEDQDEAVMYWLKI